MAGPLAQTNLFEELDCSTAYFARRRSRQQGGQLDVLLGRELTKQLECLEDEPGLLSP
jgi:hypothetical protein